MHSATDCISVSEDEEMELMLSNESDQSNQLVQSTRDANNSSIQCNLDQIHGGIGWMLLP